MKRKEAKEIMKREERNGKLSGADMISGADIPDIISSLIFISEILIFCKIVVKTLKWPKIPEDSSDFDDF